MTYTGHSIRFWKRANTAKPEDKYEDGFPLEMTEFTCTEKLKDNPNTLMEFGLIMFALIVVFLVTLSVIDEVKNDHLKKYHNQTFIK